MTRPEEYIFGSLLWAMAGIIIATDYRVSRHRPLDFLWVGITKKNVVAAQAPLVAMTIMLPFTPILRVQLWWEIGLLMLANLVLAIALLLLHNDNTRVATELATKAIAKAHAECMCCPICVFIEFGREREYCKGAFDLPDHPKFHVEYLEILEREGYR